LGNVFLGIPLDANLETNIGFFALLRPYPIVLGLAVVATFFLHGNLFAYIKAPESLIPEFKKTITPAVIAVAVTYLALVAMTIFQGVNIEKFGALSAVIAAVLFIALLLIPTMIKQDKINLAFILSILFIVGNMVLVMIGMFPNMVNDINMTNPITIYNGASSAATLKNMLIIACIGVPIVIAYTVFIYRVFRGRITD
jgi:cytochrome d ubiquinol oxidase subunit II